MNNVDRAFFQFLDTHVHLNPVVFQPVYNVLNCLNLHYSKPAIAIKADDNFLKKSVAPIANGTKAAVLAVAFAVGVVSSFLFSLISWPIRAYKFNKVHNLALKEDLKKLTPQEHEILNKQIRAYIEKKSSKGLKIDANKIDDCIEKVKASFSRSRDIYGSVAVKWVDYLINKAEANGQKLIFMARDGAAPFKLAQNMMKTDKYKQSFPGMAQEGRIVMGYFSRKVVGNSYDSPEGQKLFKEYLVNELGIKPGDNCLFVDVGFAGSMIDRITEMASDLTGIQATAEDPKNSDQSLSHSKIKAGWQKWGHLSDLEDSINKKVKVNFEYLISMTPKSTGFLATEDKRLTSVPSAGGNLGIHWLEDSHQGVVNSPTHLIKQSNGRIYANTAIPGKKQTCIDDGEEYLLRKFSKKAVTDAYKTIDPAADFKAIKNNFDATLQKIKAGQLPLLVKHV